MSTLTTIPGAASMSRKRSPVSKFHIFIRHSIQLDAINAKENFKRYKEKKTRYSLQKDQQQQRRCPVNVRPHFVLPLKGLHSCFKDQNCSFLQTTSHNANTTYGCFFQSTGSKSLKTKWSTNH